MTPSERLLNLYNLLLLDARRHYLTELAADLGCSEQAVRRSIATIERTLSRNITLASDLDDEGRRYYRLVHSTTPDTLGVSQEEVRYLALCRDLAQPFLPPETHERLGRTLRDLATGQTGTLFGTPIGFRTKGTIDYTPPRQNSGDPADSDRD